MLRIGDQMAFVVDDRKVARCTLVCLRKVVVQMVDAEVYEQQPNRPQA